MVLKPAKERPQAQARMAGCPEGERRGRVVIAAVEKPVSIVGFAVVKRQDRRDRRARRYVRIGSLDLGVPRPPVRLSGRWWAATAHVPAKLVLSSDTR
jgi:hypothetical protein